MNEDDGSEGMGGFIRNAKALLFEKFKSFISKFWYLLRSNHQEVVKVGVVVILTQIILLCGFFSVRSIQSDKNEEKQTLLHTEVAATILMEMVEKTLHAPTCTAEPKTPTSNPTATLIPTQTQLEMIYEMYPCLPRDGEVSSGEVIEVVDGDTIKVKIGLDTYSLRYIGIDCPECNAQADSAVIYGQTANERNNHLVAYKQVLLLKDVSEVDQYGRLLRYVFVDSTFVNYELVKQGYAHAAAYPPDEACYQFFAEAEREASQKSLGFWSSSFIPPTVTPLPTEDARAGCDPCYPSVCIPDVYYDLDCKDVPYKRFSVPGCDPHGFDGDNDGIGCER